MTEVDKETKRSRKKKGQPPQDSEPTVPTTGLSDDELLALQHISVNDDDGEATEITEVKRSEVSNDESEGGGASGPETDPAPALYTSEGDLQATAASDGGETSSEEGEAADVQEAGAEHDEERAESDTASLDRLGEEGAEPLGDESAGEENQELIDEAIADDLAPTDASAQVTREHLKGLIEALIFASDKPMTAAQIARAASSVLKEVKPLLAELKDEYTPRGIQLDEVAGGWIFRTKAIFAPFVRDMTAEKPVRLSRAQLETLAILAYRQPVTRPEIDEIRGVDCGAVLKLLLERDLIRMMGKKEEAGRPILYGTTTAFLEFFGLKSLKDLPTLREFTELNDDSKRIAERELGEVLDVRQPAVTNEGATGASASALLDQQEADEARREAEEIEGAEGAAAAEMGDGDPTDSEGAAAAGGEEGDESDDSQDELPAINPDDEAEFPDDDDADFDDDDDDDDDDEDDDADDGESDSDET